MLNIHAMVPPLHPDWTLVLGAALPASLFALALALLLLGRSLRRGHRAHRAELARIFEQLDLLRLDAQHAGVAEVAAQEPQLVGGVGDYYAAAQLAARGSSAAEIANRCGIVNGEARVLVALQQARSGRTSH